MTDVVQHAMPQTGQTTRRDVRRVLLVTLVLNLLVATCKIIIGLLSGALAITADGFHSIIDGSSNIVALVANALAGQPPDDDHPYGHRRYETLAALGIGLLLVLTAWELVGGALERLTGSGEAPQFTPLAFAVMLVTLLVNLGITLYERREGRRLHSELLLADAAHTGTDVFVTLSVLVSMLLVVAGWGWADTVAALLIIVLILRTAWQILSQTGSVLVDKAPYTPERLTALVLAVPAVEQVLRARSRGPLDAAQIDIDVQVAPETTTQQNAAIAAAIQAQLARHLDGVQEVEVHFVPAKTAPPNVARAVRARADALGLATHEVRVNGDGERRVLEMHVEVPAGQTLAKAHEQVTRLEQEVQAELGEFSEVLTHIEPAAAPPCDSVDAVSQSLCVEVETHALALLRDHYPAIDWHHQRVYASAEGIVLTLHAKMPPQISIEAAHQIAEQAETLLKAQVTQLARVTIHTEPES